jgi:hypothetical protein
MDADSAERERVTRELLELASVPPLDVDEERTEDDEFLSYVALGELARHIVVRRDELDSAIPSLFAHVESLLESGTPNIRNLVVVGFLETFQNNLLNSERALEDWEPVLGPRTLRAWRGVHAFWQGRMRPRAFNRRVNSGFEPSDETRGALRRWLSAAVDRLPLR